MKMMRVHVTLWIVLLLAGFLLGFVPEYLKNRDLRAQLEAPQKIIDDLKLKIQLGEVRDAANLMALELSRQNYGLARDHSAEYYTKLNDAIAMTEDPVLKKSLQDLAATRDSIMMELANPNPASISASQNVVLKTLEVTRK